MPQLEDALRQLAERAEPLPIEVLIARIETELGWAPSAVAVSEEPTMVTRQQPDIETPTPTPPPSRSRSRRGLRVASAAAVIVILAGVGIAFATGLFESDDPVADPPTTTVTTDFVPPPVEYAEIADGTIEEYPPGRYRVDQFSPATRFTIEHDWTISDFDVDGQTGFSGLRPEELAAADAEDPFVEIWGPITAWYDIATDTHVVFPPGELATRVAADPRLTDVAVTQVTVGDYPATRIEALVLDEYQTESFWLGAGYPREDGDIDWYRGNSISDAGDAAEHVVFWAIDLDGIEMLVNATYPTELADEFEPMLEAFVASIEFE